MDFSSIITKVNIVCETKGIDKRVYTKSGAGKDFVSNIKKGSAPSIEKVYLLADYLGCSVDYLLGLDDIPNRKGKISKSELTGAEKRLLTAFRELAADEQMAEVGRIEHMAEQAVKAKNAETA